MQGTKNNLIYFCFMKISEITLFTMLKLPLVYLSGVRVQYINQEICKVKVRHRWINQNPFKSIFWAVQGMAAELATGVLLMSKIRSSKSSISMLLVETSASFHKKATGKIIFCCKDGSRIDSLIDKAMKTNEGVSDWFQTDGYNQEGQIVSSFKFKWSIKVKN